MEADTATLFQMFLVVRDGIRTAIGERRRMFSSQLLAAMLARWQRLTQPAIRIFQALLAGTYRPRAPRAPSAAAVSRPRTQRKPPLAQMKHPLWLLKLLPNAWQFPYSAGFGVVELERLLAHPALPGQLDAAPALRFHLRRLCRRLRVQEPDFLFPPPEPPAPPIAGSAACAQPPAVPAPPTHDPFLAPEASAPPKPPDVEKAA